MKKVIITGIFVFSLALNAATLATLGWHIWAEKRYAESVSTPTSPLADKDLKDIYRLWPNQTRTNMKELRGRIRAKRAEVLDIIAANPQTPQAAEQSIRELTSLREQMEIQALNGISQVLATLPPEKREAFVAFLKGRFRMGPGMGGMGMGRGRHFRRNMYRGVPPCQTPDTPEAPATQRTQP